MASSDTKMSLVKEALSAAFDALRAAGVETPRLDAEVLLAEANGWDRAALAAHPEAEIPAGAARRFGEMVRRRLRREPVAYILGRKGFRRIELAVDRRVLVPRPETELLVELALELRPRSVLDVGTGSGAVALAIADELPGCEVTATDTSAAALEVARANAERLGLSDRVRFEAGSLPAEAPAPVPRNRLGPMKPAPRNRLESDRLTPADDPTVGPGPVERSLFDLVVANLPYVAEADWAALQPEVREWEPREALLAGPDGLDAIRAATAALAPDRVRPSARYAGETANAPAALALEVGEGQAEAVSGLMRDAGFRDVRSRRDLAGIERVVWGRR